MKEIISCINPNKRIKDFVNSFNSENVSTNELFSWAKESNNSYEVSSATKFTTSNKFDYQSRTKENADWSDITIAFALDFNTAGEKLTKRVAGDKYISSQLPADYDGYLPYDNESAYGFYAKQIYEELKKKGKTSNIKLNIAGNGIYSLKGFATQEELNDYVTNLLRDLQSLGVTISEIRSGGQTGVDEAGIIAAQRLGISNEVHTTADWKFRNEKGEDIKGEEVFKQRFNSTTLIKTNNNTSKNTSIEEVLDLIRVFCSKKGIKQEEWEKYEDEAMNFVEETLNGGNPYVKPISPMERSISRLKSIINTFKTFVFEDKDFEKTHIYYYIDSKGNKKKVDLSVTEYKAAINKDENFDIKEYEKTEFSTNVGMTLGNTFDSLCRDYFTNNLKKAYPNLTSAQLKQLITQLNSVKNYFNTLFGEGKWHIEANPFPIAAEFTDSKGKKFTVGGELDLILTTADGNIYIYDMKALNVNRISSKTQKDNIIKDYRTQLSLYKKILTTQFPELSSKIKGLGLLIAETSYPYGKIGREYSINEGNQLFYNGTKIQELDNFSIVLSNKLSTNNSYITPVSYTMFEGVFSLTKEELQIIKEDPYLGQFVATDADFQNTMNLQNEVVSNDPVVDIETLKDTCPLSQTEITNVSTTISKFLAFYINKLQNEDTYREIIFPNEPAYSFIGLDPIDMLTDNRIKTLLKYIRKTSFNVADTSVDDPNFNKLMWVVSNFDYLFQLSASKFLKYTGVTINAEEKDVDDQMSDELIMLDSTESKEEDGREPYAYDARETPVMVSMQQGLKTALSLIPEKEIEIDVVDGRIKILKEEKVYDETFGNLKFLDENVVIGVLYNKLHLSEDRNEMLSILKDPENIMKYPWFLTIYRMLINSPELTTKFYTTFRKNKTNYVKTDFPRWNWKTESREANNSELLNYIKKDKVKSTFITNVTTGNTELFIPKKGSVIGESELDREVALLLKDQLKEVNNKQPKEKIKIISKTLRYLGFGDYEYNLKTYKDGSSINALHFHLSKFIDFLLDADRGYIIPYLNTINGDKSPISQIYSYLVSMTIIEAPVSAYDKGKNYQVWTPPSFLGDLIGHINKDGEENVTDFIDRKYGKSKQTAIIKKGEFIEFVSSWLNIIKNDPKKALEIEHLVETSAFDKQYKEMGILLYPLSTIIEYFAPRRDTRTRDTIGRFPVPTMSDKPASEYIKAFIHAFTNSDAKDRIAEDSVNFVLMEINRIRTVLEDAVKNRRQIDNYSPKIPKSVLNKFKKHTLTIKDFSEKGNIASWMEIGGARFQFFTFFNDALLTNKEFSESIINYLNYKTDDDFNIKLTPTIKKIFKENMEEGAKSFKTYIKSIIDPKYLNSFILCPGLTNEEALEEFYWNYRLGAANMLALTIIDPAFYKNATDLQKRFAQVHAMTDRCDIYATFIDKDGARKRFSEDGQHRFLILEDLIKPSYLKEIAAKLFDKMIEKEQDVKIKEYIRKKKERVLSAYDKVTVTDGQAFSSPEGFFKKLGMLGLLSNKQKEAFFRLRNGEFNVKDIDTIFQPFKPFVYDWENVGTEDEPWYVSFQLKDSEAMIAVTGYIAQGLMKQGILLEDSPLFKLFDILHNSAYTDEKWNGKGIDTIVFKSGVKCGASNVLSLEDLGKLDTSTIEDIKGYLEKKGYIHTHSFYSWGKQQEVPAHYQNHEQSMPSQTRILSVLNIKDNADIKFRGEIIKGKEFKKMYFNAISDDFYSGVKNIINMFGLKKDNNIKTYKLSYFLTEVLKKDARTTAEQYKAVSLDNGEFNIPLGDPVNMDKYASNIFSKIKKEVNKEKIPGGPIVQTTCFGLNPPKININEDGSVRSIGIYISIPTKELEEAITNADGTIKTKEEIIKEGIMKEEDFFGISSRIPVETKYSMFPTEIEGFLPRSIGEMAIFPEEVTVINGSDFDIDKAYPELKYFGKDKDRYSKEKERKNLIVDLQYAALSSVDNAYELLSPQDISPLIEIASIINPAYKKNSLDMTMPEAQYYYQNQNMTGKEMVAIAASTNVSHGSLSLCDIRLKVPNLAINGVHFNDFSDEDGYIQLDPEYSKFDGSYISDYIAMLVGAAADNAKNPIVSNIGFIKTTSGIYTALLRLGVPLKTVSLLMSQPSVLELIRKSESSKKSFNSLLLKDLQEKKINIEQFKKNIENYNITDEDLTTHLNDKISSNYQTTIKAIIASFLDVSNDVFKISQVVKLNSTQNAVGPNIWKVIKNTRGLLDFIYSRKTDNNFKGDVISNIFENLPFLKPLVECYTDLVPAIMKNHFTPFTQSFTGLLDYIDNLGVSVSSFSEKKLRDLFNEFMIYLSTGTLNDRTLIDASFKERKRMFYEFPNYILNKKNTIDNPLIQLFNYTDKVTKRENIPAIYLDTANYDSAYRDSLSSYWADLINKDTIGLSNDLILYNIFRGGFGFTPKGFLNIAPNIAKKAFTNNAYMNIAKASNWDFTLEESDYENFIKQRIRNSTINSSDFILDILDEDLDENNVIIKGGTLISKISLPDNVKAITSKGRLFLQSKSDSSIFTEVTSLGFEKQGFEYNRLEDAIEMKTVKEEASKKSYRKKEIKRSSEDEADEKPSTSKSRKTKDLPVISIKINQDSYTEPSDNADDTDNSIEGMDYIRSTYEESLEAFYDSPELEGTIIKLEKEGLYSMESDNIEKELKKIIKLLEDKDPTMAKKTIDNINKLKKVFCK